MVAGCKPDILQSADWVGIRFPERDEIVEILSDRYRAFQAALIRQAAAEMRLVNDRLMAASAKRR
jgi:hypothetical protein